MSTMQYDFRYFNLLNPQLPNHNLHEVHLKRNEKLITELNYSPDTYLYSRIFEMPKIKQNTEFTLLLYYSLKKLDAKTYFEERGKLDTYLVKTKLLDYIMNDLIILSLSFKFKVDDLELINEPNSIMSFFAFNDEIHKFITPLENNEPEKIIMVFDLFEKLSFLTNSLSNFIHWITFKEPNDIIYDLKSKL
jgi:hypothetical protein